MEHKTQKPHLILQGQGEEEWDSTFQLLSWWRKERIAAAKVMVVGAGALGNEVLKNLALLGVGHILIVDMDHIEYSNLSRSILYRPEDSKYKRMKADVAADGGIPLAGLHVLAGGSLLQEKLALAIEDKDVNGLVQQVRIAVAGGARGLADALASLIHQVEPFFAHTVSVPGGGGTSSSLLHMGQGCIAPAQETKTCSFCPQR